MKTRAAVIHEAHTPWEVVELEVDDPRPHEVLVRWVASGICYSDLHMVHGDVRPRFPMIGGHEGAGYIEAVGEGVTDFAVGDAVICAFIPSCGRCRWCATGQQALCDQGASTINGNLPGGHFAFHRNGLDYGALGTCASFAQHAILSEYSVVKIEDDVPFESVCIVGCGVPTGWGSAVYSADVLPGDTVIVIGTGGVGINAVQGARYAGAKRVIAVDPVALKREVAEQVGATHAVATVEEAHALAQQLTRGVGADKTIVTVNVIRDNLLNQALDTVSKGGTLVITSWADDQSNNLNISSVLLTAYNRRIQGTLFGSSNPNYDIPRLVDLYRQGDLKLDELITRTYTLDQINDACDDLENGRNMRGVILHDAV